MIQLKCFGGAVARTETGSECPLRSRKHLGLLLYIAATPRTVHSREELALFLWNAANRRARHSLSQAIYDVRTRLGPILQVTSQSVSLSEDRIDFEARHFETAIKRGAYQRALDLYRGDFAANLSHLGAETFDRWLDGERERFRTLASVAIRNAQRDAEERGDWDQMCLAALRLIRHNDLDEEAHVSLMRGLWIKGDPASALLHGEALVGRDSKAHWPLVLELAAQIKQSGASCEVLSVPRRPLQVMGRHSEFRTLFRQLWLPSAGGRTVAVTGERGIGKTILLQEIARCAAVAGRPVKWMNHRALKTPAHSNSRFPRAVNGAVYFLDLPTGAAPDIRRLPEHVGDHDIVTYVASRLPLSSDAKRRCGLIASVHLGPLSPEALEHLIRVRFPELTPSERRPLLELSGGNPQLAIAIARSRLALRSQPHLGDVHSLAAELLSGRSGLSDLVDCWIGDLSPYENELAELLAIASGESRAVLEPYLTQEQQAALRSLRARGWVNRAGPPTFLRPILRYALELQGQSESQLRNRRWLAETLHGGGPKERYAAAIEYERAGSRDTARGLAAGVAMQALRKGNAALATAASEVACRTAATARDRFNAGLLLAESALSRGSAAEAATVLRALDGLAPDPAAALDVAIKLGKATIAEGTIEEAARRLCHQGPEDEAIDDPVRAARCALELAQLRLNLVMLESGQSTAALPAQSAAALERQVGQSRHMAGAFPVTWSEAVRTLFGYYVTVACRADARKMLARHGDTLIRLGDPGATVLETCRAVVELRAARLHTAERILRELVAKRGPAADRLQAVALNNLSVTLLESGRFQQAVAELERTSQVDGEVGLPGRDRITAHMNLAQCAFFNGLAKEARGHCRTVLRIARRHELHAMEAQALAITGLLAFWAGRHGRVEQKCLRTKELLPRVSRDADSYLVDWFVGVVQFGDGGNDVRERLAAAAATYEGVDRLASAKLHVLAAGMAIGEPQTSDVLRDAAQTLRGGGCGWFMTFAERCGVLSRSENSVGS